MLVKTHGTGSGYIGRTALLLIAALILCCMGPWAAQVHAQVDMGAVTNVRDKIDLTKLKVTLGGYPVYELGNSNIPSVQLDPNSTMTFSLEWKVKSEAAQYSFQKGDYFEIPIAEVAGLRLDNPIISELKASLNSTDSVVVANGRFAYNTATQQLAYTVVFNGNAQSYDVIDGGADGTAQLSVAEGQTGILIKFNNETTSQYTVTQKITEIPLPSYPEVLETMNKRVVSPEIEGGRLVMSTRVAPVPERSGVSMVNGIDWRLTFFDAARAFEQGQTLTGNQYVIIEDTLSANQSFSNFRKFENEREKGFQTNGGKAANEPFYLEIPVVAYGNNRILSSGVIRGGVFTQITSGDIESLVRAQPLTWGVAAQADGKEKLIINVGLIGPGVADGSGLTSTKVSGDFSFDLLSKLTEEIYAAHKKITSLTAAQQSELASWTNVRKNDLETLFYYWPSIRASVSTQLGVADTAEAIIAKIITYDNSAMEQLMDNIASKDGSIPVNAFIVHYRSIVKDAAQLDIANHARISSTGFIGSKEDQLSYKHQFEDRIRVSARSGEILFIKASTRGTTVDGLTTEDAFNKVSGFSGAVFEVYEAADGKPTGNALTFTQSGSAYAYSTGGATTRLTTDASGMFSITQLSQGKKYVLKEVSSPDGFYEETLLAPFSVTATGQYYVMRNTPRVVRLIKVDDAGKPLGGAEFGVYKENGDKVTGFVDNGGYYTYEKGAGTDSVTTPSDGELEIRGLPDGKYYFKEISAPAGYKLADQKYPFELSRLLPATAQRIVDAGSAVNTRTGGGSNPGTAGNTNNTGNTGNTGSTGGATTTGAQGNTGDAGQTTTTQQTGDGADTGDSVNIDGNVPLANIDDQGVPQTGDSNTGVKIAGALAALSCLAICAALLGKRRAAGK